MRKKGTAATGKLSLTARQRERLLQAWRTAAEARLYRRLHALVQIDRGKPVSHVAKELEVSRVTVHRWLRRFLDSRDPWDVSDRSGRGRPCRWTAELQALVEQALQAPPSQAGHLSTHWTLPLVQEHLLQRSGQRLSLSTLRRHLHGLDFAYKRPRHRLQPDPEYRKKTGPTDAPGGAGPSDGAVGPG